MLPIATGVSVNVLMKMSCILSTQAVDISLQANLWGASDQH